MRSQVSSVLSLYDRLLHEFLDFEVFCSIFFSKEIFALLAFAI